MSRQINRPRTIAGSKLVSARISAEAERSLNDLRQAFQTRYPKGVFPCLSHLLQIAIDRYLAQFGADPAKLKQEAKDFQRRYGSKRVHSAQPTKPEVVGDRLPNRTPAT